MFSSLKVISVVLFLCTVIVIVVVWTKSRKILKISIFIVTSVSIKLKTLLLPLTEHAAMQYNFAEMSKACISKWLILKYIKIGQLC